MNLGEFRKRGLALLVCLALCLPSSLVAFADETTEATTESTTAEEEEEESESESSSSGGDAGYDEELANKAQKELGATDEQVAQYKAAWLALTLEGSSKSLSKACVAGMFGNSWGECSWDTKTVESGNTGAGFGAYGFTSRVYQEGMQTFSQTCGHKSELVTLKTTSGTWTVCPHISCQTLYTISALSGWGVGHLKQDFSAACALFPNDVDQNMKLIPTLEEFKTTDNIHDAAASFLAIFEKSASINLLIASDLNPDAMTNSKIGNKQATRGEWFIFGFGNKARPYYADLAYTIMTGTAIPADGNVANEMATGMVSAGYWTEEELAAYAKVVNDLNVDKILQEARRSDLTQDDLEGVALWERNVFDDIEQGGFIRFARILVQIFGIMFTVWMVFLYLAYWFDRVNNFFYIDTLGILSFGYLHMSDTEEECTFHLKDLGKDNRKTVNHRAILFIVLIGIAFGVFIISGFYYEVLNSLFRLILRVVGVF